MLLLYPHFHTIRVRFILPGLFKFLVFTSSVSLSLIFYPSVLWHSILIRLPLFLLVIKKVLFIYFICRSWITWLKSWPTFSLGIQLHNFDGEDDVDASTLVISKTHWRAGRSKVSLCRNLFISRSIFIWIKLWALAIALKTSTMSTVVILQTSNLGLASAKSTEWWVCLFLWKNPAGSTALFAFREDRAEQSWMKKLR